MRKRIDWCAELDEPVREDDYRGTQEMPRPFYEAMTERSRAEFAAEIDAREIAERVAVMHAERIVDMRARIARQLALIKLFLWLLTGALVFLVAPALLNVIGGR